MYATAKEVPLRGIKFNHIRPVCRLQQKGFLFKGQSLNLLSTEAKGVPLCGTELNPIRRLYASPNGVPLHGIELNPVRHCRRQQKGFLFAG